jgi:hypothetical protein
MVSLVIDFMHARIPAEIIYAENKARVLAGGVLL